MVRSVLGVMVDMLELLGDETTVNVIRNYVLRQGTKEEKKDYRQLKLSVF